MNLQDSKVSAHSHGVPARQLLAELAQERWASARTRHSYVLVPLLKLTRDHRLTRTSLWTEKYTLQLVTALVYCHRNNVIHRYVFVLHYRSGICYLY